jgi:flagellar M-ring protein FliF
VESFLQSIRGLGPARMAVIAAAVLAVFGGLAMFLSTASSPNLALMYSDLNPSDAGAIVQQLEAQQIPYKASPDGTRIEVPSDQVGRLRMLMAQQGLPSGGNVGYELFDKGSVMGTTTQQQAIQQLRAMEGELARTVQSLQPVQTARVHLVLPKREMFSRQNQQATASVTVRTRPGAQLSKEQVLAIQTLIGAAVPQLEPNMVSIVDDRGRLLARAAPADSKDAMMSNVEEKRLAVEQRLTQTVEALLARSVGQDRVQARVAVEMDFDRITTNSEIYDPDGQVVRGTQNVTENSEDQNRDGIDPVTVANNLPSSDASNSATGTSSAKTSRTEETVNYEISKTVKVHERESGQIRRLSLALLVDGTYAPGPDGQPVYSPRPEAELNQLRALAEKAVGFDAGRGDEVEIVNMRFAPPDGADALVDDTILGMPRQDIFRIAETVVLAIVAILVILLVIRPLVARALDRTPQLEEEPDLLSDAGGVPALSGPGGGALARELALEAAQANEELEQMIDINRVDGRVRASSLRKVGEIVEKHPEEAVSIIRNWLYQEN